MSDSTHAPASATGKPLRTMPTVGPLKMIARALLNGNADRMDMHGMLRRQRNEFGDVVANDAVLMKMVNLFGPDANRFVLLDQERIFSARKPWMAIMGRIFPNGLLLLDGDEHKHHRKIMHEAFKRPVLRSYTERMNPIIETVTAEWQHEGDDFLVFPHIKALTLQMAAEIFVGIDLGPETTRMNEAFENLVAASMSRIRLPIPGLEFQRGLAARKFMVDFFGGMIPQKRAGDAPDLFSRLTRARTDDGDQFTDQQIIDHMSFLMMAAHDTTTSTLTSMFYELAKNPDWQERVREECNAIGDGPIGFEDMDRFEQLSLVFKETIRRYPPLPVIPRVATRAFEWKGYHVPEGSMVVVSPIVTHHMSEWWDDPWKFQPDRFGPERAEQERHTHSWIPFGGGPHMCIGLRFAEAQVKTVMHNVVRRYRWSVPDGYEMPVQQAPISKPTDGLPVKLERL